jgi:hypothetical protein
MLESSAFREVQHHAPPDTRRCAVRTDVFVRARSGNARTRGLRGLPIRVTLDWPTRSLIKPTLKWQTATVHLGNPSDFRMDDNFYVVPKAVDATRRP